MKYSFFYSLFFLSFFNGIDAMNQAIQRSRAISYAFGDVQPSKNCNGTPISITASSPVVTSSPVSPVSPVSNVSKSFAFLEIPADAATDTTADAVAYNKEQIDNECRRLDFLGFRQEQLRILIAKASKDENGMITDQQILDEIDHIEAIICYRLNP